MTTLILKTISKLPFPLLYLLSDLGYLLIRYFFKYRRGVVKDNLRRSFPEKDEKEIESVANQFYRYFADVMLEIVKTAGMTQEELEERVVLANSEVLDELATNEKPFILVTAHYGNWEWLLHSFAKRIAHPVTAIYQPLHNERINQYMLETRMKFGAELLCPKELFSELAKRKRSMRVIAMSADQLPIRREEKYWAKFLNQDTAFYVGVEKLAQITKYPVYFASARRTRRGHYEATLKKIAEPPYSRDDEHAIVEQYARETERVILEDPPSWLWSHKRWKYKKPLYS